MRADGRHADIAGDARLARQVAIVDVELDQRLRVFRYEAQRIEHHADLVRGGATDLRFGRGPDPAQRANAALIAHRPVDGAEMLADRRGGLLDLALIGIARPDGLLG